MSTLTPPSPKGEGVLAIDVEGLTKRFGDKTVVDNFSMQVPRGSIYGFLGPTEAARRPRSA
jgi:ABC-2 type transport system ATP-binding protein